MTKLAIDTVLYAAQCVRSNERELALNAIRDTGDLTLEEQQALEKIIKELGTSLTRANQHLAEAKMIGVLKPNAEEPAYARMVDLYLKVGQAGMGYISMTYIQHCLESTTNREEFWENFPELDTLELDKNSDDMPSISKGIQASCPKFKCLKYSNRKLHSTELINKFSNIIQTLIWKPQGYDWFERIAQVEHLNAWAKLPHLTEIIFGDSKDLNVFHAPPEVFDQLTRLEKLTIQLKDEGMFATYKPDQKLAVLARIPNLQTIDVRNSDLTYEGVRQFALVKRQTLKQMTLSLSDKLNKNQFAQLQKELPTILFTLVEREKK